MPAEISKKQPRGRPFKPGQSGNAGGRPKLPEEVKHVREMAREYTSQAVQALVAVLDSKNDSARVAAANALIDRGWGKSEQPLVGADGGAIKTESRVQVSGLTDEQLRALASIPVQSD